MRLHIRLHPSYRLQVPSLLLKKNKSLTCVYKFSDKTVRIWDWVPGSGYVERSDSPLRGHKYQVTCVRISPQGAMLASASVDGTAILWNLQLGVKLYTMVQVNGDAIRVCR
jgi:WD40 repeat protein